MEIEHALFLFGPTEALRRHHLADLDDPDARQLLFEEVFAAEVDALGLDANARRFHFTLREVLANQIVDGDPPEAWATVVRLRELGLPDPVIRSELHLAIGAMVRTALLADREGGEDGADPAEIQEGYLLHLIALPGTPLGVAATQVVDEVRTAAGTRTRREILDVIVDGHIERTGSEDAVDQLTNELDHALHELSTPPSGLLVTADDFPVLASTLLPTALTTVASDPVRWTVSEDLALFEHVAAPHIGPVPVVRIVEGAGAERTVLWDLGDAAPAIPAGRPVEVAVDAAGAVTITELREPVAVAPEHVDAVRRAYDDHVDDLPVSMDELAAALALTEHDWFGYPHAPLSQLVDAAGLERRGRFVGHERRQWTELDRELLLDELLDDVEPMLGFRLVPVIAALTTFADGEAITPGDPVYDALREREALHLAVALLFDRAPTFSQRPSSDGDLERFAQLLLDHADGPAQAAPARWLLAAAADRAGDPLAAIAHLELAHEADPTWPPATDHLASFAADRSEFERARTMWRTVDKDVSDFAAYRDAVNRVPRPPAIALGRNDPCWCGSGRKHKHCHLGTPPLLPLSDRAPLVGAKVVSWFMHGTAADPEHDIARRLTDRFATQAGLADALDDIDELSEEQQQALFEAVVSNPVIVDAIRIEGGALAGYVAARGAILPDDERELAEQWLAVPRTVYEVIAVDHAHHEPILVLDRRRGAELRVADTTPTTEALVTGDVICARAIPDGDGHRFDGAIIAVRDDAVDELLLELDHGRPETVIDLAAAALRRRLDLDVDPRG